MFPIPLCISIPSERFWDPPPLDNSDSNFESGAENGSVDKPGKPPNLKLGLCYYSKWWEMECPRSYPSLACGYTSLGVHAGLYYVVVAVLSPTRPVIWPFHLQYQQLLRRLTGKG